MSQRKNRIVFEPFNFLQKYLFESFLFISVASLCFYQAGYLLIGKYLDANIFRLLLILASSFFIYNINFASRLVKGKNKLKLFLLALSFIGYIAIAVLKLNLKEFLFLAHLGVLSVLYNFPNQNVALRVFPYVKIFIIAYVWAALSSFFPAIIMSQPILSAKILLVFIAHFFFILSITIPFDIRDYHKDKIKELHTLPHLFGEKGSKILSLILLIIFTYMAIQLHVKTEFIIPFTVATAALVILSSPRRNNLFYIGTVDGTIVIYALIVYFSVI